jgi:hypothetical protein
MPNGAGSTRLRLYLVALVALLAVLIGQPAAQAKPSKFDRVEAAIDREALRFCRASAIPFQIMEWSPEPGTGSCAPESWWGGGKPTSGCIDLACYRWWKGNCREFRAAPYSVTCGVEVHYPVAGGETCSTENRIENRCWTDISGKWHRYASCYYRTQFYIGPTGRLFSYRTRWSESELGGFTTTEMAYSTIRCGLRIPYEQPLLHADNSA